MTLWTLTILIGLLGADGDDAKPAPAPAPAAAPSTLPPQDPDRSAVSAADLKALRETNIFAPKTVKRLAPRVTSTTSSRSSVPTPYRQKPPILTAIYLDLATNAQQVIVEDRNDSSHRYFKDPKFMRTGDEWAGVKIESITQDVAVFSKDGVSKEVRIGESLPETDAKPLSSTEGADEGANDDGETPASAGSEAKPRIQTSEEQNRVLEEMRRRNRKKNRPGVPQQE